MHGFSKNGKYNLIIIDKYDTIHSNDLGFISFSENEHMSCYIDEILTPIL